jgi:hypothetical protein
LPFGKGEFGQAPINAGTGGINETLHPGFFRQFNEVDKAFQVRLLVGKRVDQGVAHPGLGRQMADLLGPVVRKQPFQARKIGQVALKGGKIGKLAQFLVPGSL